MRVRLVLCGILTAVAAWTAHADTTPSYLSRVRAVIADARGDIPAMQAVVETAAKHLADGGQLYAAGQPSMISELNGRAGGFGRLLWWRDQPLGEKDVILYFDDGVTPFPDAILESMAYVVYFGAADHPRASASFNNHAAKHAVSPTLANAIPGWIFTGELFAALTRLGKVPAMLESIGAYNSSTRNAPLQAGPSLFHDGRESTAVHPGALGNQYCETIDELLKRVELDHADRLRRAAKWARESIAGGGKVYCYSMGHLFPDEISNTAIGKVFISEVYNAGFRESPVPSAMFEPRDTIIHIGYQHPPQPLIDRASAAGSAIVYFSLYADRDHLDDINVLWIDSYWPWTDACVSVPGYEVPLLPASGIVNGALAWELFELATN